MSLIKIRPIIGLMTLAAMLAGCVTQPPKQYQDQIPPIHFFNTASFSDDPMEPAVVITTQEGFKPAPGLLGRVHDVYLRAFVDRKTGAAIYQVYTWLRYPSDKSWRFYETANYMGPDGLKTVPIKKIGQGDVDCSLRALGCVYTEQMGFPISEPELRALAATYTSTPDISLQFRLKSQSGIDYNGDVYPAEILGLLSRVDEYRMQNGLLKP